MADDDARAETDLESLTRALNAADVDYSQREFVADMGHPPAEPGDWFTFLAAAALAWQASRTPAVADREVLHRWDSASDDRTCVCGWAARGWPKAWPVEGPRIEAEFAAHLADLPDGLVRRAIAESVRVAIPAAALVVADVDALRAAIMDAGRAPAYHNQVMRRHRREWPTLWTAIDALLERK